ncbi:MAG: ribonuclease H-like YkuK family protein [Candidatus Levybacteria bacterium]|nr:ribonuclease H-like YkuK family protein [Candidatus Levybacteria bacterium]
MVAFQSLTYGSLKMEDVIFYIKAFLEEMPDASYSLIIGTDSHERSGNVGKNGRNLNLVTAILVHRKGFGGRYFWRRKEKSNIHSLREKIYAETMMSLNFAFTFVPLLKRSLNGKAPNYNLEIHIDVGEHGDTRDMIKEVVGMVTGNGFVAKTKPEAFGASSVADKHA